LTRLAVFRPTHQRINTMVPRIFFGLGLSLALFSSAHADAVHWTNDIQQARRQAFQEDRLLLVHVIGPNCLYCDRLEKNVLSRQDVADEIERYYVPVKIDSSRARDFVRRLGVTHLPSDVVLTPQGQMLHRALSPQDPRQYVDALVQVAADARERLARQPSRPVPATAPATAPATTSKNRPGAAVAEPPVSVPAMIPPDEAPQNSQSYLDRRGNVSGLVAGDAFPAPPSLDTPEISVRPPADPPKAAASSSPDSPAPLALDGFCPVSLAAVPPQWKKGEKRFGAVHRGRTYLFTGAEEQRRFLADPDGFTPVLSGADPVIFSREGRLVDGRRAHGIFFGRQVYLFADENTLEEFWQAPQRYARSAIAAMRRAEEVQRR